MLPKLKDKMQMYAVLTPEQELMGNWPRGGNKRPPHLDSTTNKDLEQIDEERLSPPPQLMLSNQHPSKKPMHL